MSTQQPSQSGLQSESNLWLSTLICHRAMMVSLVVSLALDVLQVEVEEAMEPTLDSLLMLVSMLSLHGLSALTDQAFLL